MAITTLLYCNKDEKGVSSSVGRDVVRGRLALLLLLAPGTEGLSTQSHKELKSMQILRKQHHRRQAEKDGNTGASLASGLKC